MTRRSEAEVAPHGDPAIRPGWLEDPDERPEAARERTAAIVTGAGSGLGRAIALELAARGWPVVAAGRTADRLETTVGEIVHRGGRALAVRCDVRDREAVRAMVARAEETFGGVEILVNNAAGNFVIRAEELSPGGWEAVRGIVLDGTWNCSQEVGRRMIASGRGGSILNVVATYARTGAGGVVHSVSAKAGVLAMTRALALEWGRFRIRVNALAPGIVLTENAARNLGFADPDVQARLALRVPLGRLATPEEVARLAADLAGDWHPYVTGDCWTVDGGLWIAGFPDLRRALEEIQGREQ